jgi:hypothetical protein
MNQGAYCITKGGDQTDTFVNKNALKPRAINLVALAGAIRVKCGQYS